MLRSVLLLCALLAAPALPVPAATVLPVEPALDRAAAGDKRAVLAEYDFDGAGGHVASKCGARYDRK